MATLKRRHGASGTTVVVASEATVKRTLRLSVVAPYKYEKIRGRAQQLGVEATFASTDPTESKEVGPVQVLWTGSMALVFRR